MEVTTNKAASDLLHSPCVTYNLPLFYTANNKPTPNIAVHIVSSRMPLIETERLVIDYFHVDDAAFIVKLVNTPGWLQYIGDRNIKSLEDARLYLQNGPLKSYQERGFGLYRVALKQSGTAIGMCGLIKRDGLDVADIGFALLPEYCGKGYAYEAAEAVVNLARHHFKMPRLAAILQVDNAASLKLLQKLGLRFEKMVNLGYGDLAMLSIEL